MERKNRFMSDNVRVNKMFGFDYSFCYSDCSRTDCGRNEKSKSFEAMKEFKFLGIYTAADFSSVCTEYKKGEEDGGK